MKNPTCYVCGHPIGSGLQVLSAPEGKDMVARHKDECAPGTKAWAMKFPHSLMGQYYHTRNTEGAHDDARAIS